MPISYTGEGYKLQPQFADLSRLQGGLQPLDVTRKISVEYRPLAQLQVPSSQPELVTNALIQAGSQLTGGILGGIESAFKEKKEKEKSDLEFSRQKELAEIKTKAYDPYLEALKTRKLEAETSSAEKRLNEVLPSKLPSGATRRFTTPIIEAALPNNQTTNEDPIDLTKPPGSMDFEPKQPLSLLDSSGIKSGVEDTAKQLLNISPEYLTASTDGGIVFDEKPKPLEENLPPTTIGQFSVNFISPAEQKRLEEKFEPLGFKLKTLDRSESKFLSSIQKPVVKEKPKTPKSGDVDTEEQAQQMAYEDIPGFKVGEYEQLMDENGVSFFRVKPRAKMSAKEIAEEQKAKSEAKAAESAPVLSKDQIGIYDKLAANVQQNPLIKNAIDAKSSQSVIHSSLAENNGFGDITAINAFQRMVDPGVAVREGDVTLLQSAIPRLRRLGLTAQNLIAGDKLTPEARMQLKELSLRLAKTRVELAKESISDLRETAKDAGINPDRVVRELNVDKQKEEIQQGRKEALAAKLDAMADKQGTPEYKALYNELKEMVMQEKKAQQQTIPQTPARQPASQPVFQPPIPKPATEYGESLESFFGYK